MESTARRDPMLADQGCVRKVAAIQTSGYVLAFLSLTERSHRRRYRYSCGLTLRIDLPATTVKNAVTGMRLVRFALLLIRRVIVLTYTL